MLSSQFYLLLIEYKDRETIQIHLKSFVIQSNITLGGWKV